MTNDSTVLLTQYVYQYCESAGSQPDVMQFVLSAYFQDILRFGCEVNLVILHNPRPCGGGDRTLLNAEVLLAVGDDPALPTVNLLYHGNGEGGHFQYFEVL